MKILLNQIKETKAIRDNGDIESLKKSILDIGLINPITIDSEYNLLAGRRRFRAISELGWSETEVTVLPINGDRLKAMRVTIDENLKRKPLTDPENRALIAQYDELKRQIEGNKSAGNPNLLQCNELGGWTQKATAEDLHISQPSVNQAIQAEEIVKQQPEWANLKTKQILHKAKVEAQKEQIKTLTKLDGLYDVIVIDPPWEIKGSYDPDSRRATPDYPMMSYAEIADIEIPASDNCILWLWVTNLDLHEGFHLIEKWGFEYKNILTWAKDKFGLGVWMRGQTEHCLLAVKGKPLFTGESISTLLGAPTSGHSIKPDAFYELVDKCCYGRKLDYFGGKERDGWDRYGAQRVSL